MSIATEISRIQTNRNTIRNKLIDLGLATSTAKLDALATAIADIVDRGAVSVEILEGTTYTIPAGYHNGSGTVKAMSDTKGDAETYKTQTKSVTPTKKQQSVSPDTGYYALSSVTVAPIPDAYQDVSTVNAAAGDVLTGKIYVTADGTITTGTMANNGKVSKTLDATTITYTIPKGYHSGTGTVTITLEEKSVTPTKATQTITPTSDKVLSKVTVNPIPDEYITTDDATATAADILKDKTAYVDGEKITGTMPNNGKVSEVLFKNKNTYTIPEGYHNGEGTVVVRAGDKTVTPNESTQTITGDVSTDGSNSYTQFLGTVTVNPIPAYYGDASDAGDATIVAPALLKGMKVIALDEDDKAVEVVGEMTNNGKVTVVLDTTTTSTDIAEGYHNGEGTVSISPETKTATPTKSTQNITPSSGKVLSNVTVNPIPAAYQDVTSVNAVATDVLAGKKIVNSSGTVVTGTMANNGSASAMIDGLTTTSATIPAGYTSGGAISLSNDIEEALAAI